jgi:hypothetical protein
MSKMAALYYCIYILALCVATCREASAFTQASCRSPFAQTATTPITAQQATKDNENNSLKSNNVHVVQWEGCLADCIDWRIDTGIVVALQVWPLEIKDLAPTAPLGNDKDGEWTWLRNKLNALSHVLDGSSGDFVLATRLLLEEQALDRGRSVGKTGKYASKYHPRAASDVSDENAELEAESTSLSNYRQSRPLTVGEISVNWSETLRDTLRTRYHCNMNDPLPIIRQACTSLYNEGKEDISMPTVRSDPLEKLVSMSGTKIVLCSRNELEIAYVTLKSGDASVTVRVAEVAEECTQQHSTDVVYLLPESAHTINTVLEACPAGSTVHVIDSSWERLQRHIALFGDYIPRTGVGKTIVADRMLSISLAEWAPNSHPNQHSAAVMNAWTRLISLNDLVPTIQE